MRDDGDDVIYWDRHTGGHVRVGPLMQSIPMLRQPVLSHLRLEWIDYRPGLVAILREHACGQRYMTADEIAACEIR